MLSATLEFKDVFPRYQQRDVSYTSLPSEEEWRKVQVICKFLGEFEELTKLISGSKYPTANLFLPELVLIKNLLKEKSQETFMVVFVTTIREILRTLYRDWLRARYGIKAKSRDKDSIKEITLT
ncbi:hypothetical protein C2S53_018347 [Perilla frutescens var. hirtella]|uniref:Uncharacterized protein n=1 Tax=Perilla frutescens var. hirtella TaxID=608512 RepID=A0AAD4NWL0_PERFH|nr:hypothetical protein C2S53_018347 [Perilla frutescens var. hirtella]